MEEPLPAPATKDSDLKQRQRSFNKAYTAFQTQAASLVGLTRQFKELQARWGSTEEDLRTRFREVGNREREAGAREKKMEETKAEMEAVEKQLESSKYHLVFLKPLIAKHVEELDDLKVMVREKKEKCDLIEKRGLESAERLGILEKCVEEKTREVAAKEEEMRVVEGKIEGVKRECGLKEEEIEAKRRRMEEWEKEMEVKKGELVDQVDAMEILVRGKGKECELIENRILELSKRECYFGRCVEERRKEFENKEKVLREVEGRIRLKESELDGVLKSMEERAKECELKGTQVEAMQMSIENCEKEMEVKRDEWSCKLEMKERELERLFEKFELRGEQFEPIVEELRVIEKRVDECLNEGLIKERYLQSSEKSIQERERALEAVSHELEMKGRHIEEGATQLELKKTQFDCQMKTQQLEREKYFASSLKKLLEQQDQSLDVLQTKIEAVKKLSEGKHEQQGRAMELKPKLFYSQQVGREVQLVLLRESMEEFEKQFSRFQKSVQDQIKHLDSLSHALHISESQVQGRELDLKLKNSDFEVNTERLELTPASDDMIIPEFVSDQLQIFTDGRSSEVIPAVFDADEIFKLLGLISQNKQTLQKCQTLWLEDKIIDIVRSLIERKQLIEAVRYICTFKLNDKFDPVPLLIEFVENAKKRCNDRLREVKSHVEEEKVVDDRIAELRALLQCIEDHNLEFQYPSIGIMMDIHGLEKLKGNGKLRPSLSPTVEKQEQTGVRKRSSSSLYPTPHTYQLRKRT